MRLFSILFLVQLLFGVTPLFAQNDLAGGASVADSTKTAVAVRASASHADAERAPWTLAASEFEDVIAEDVLDYFQLLPGVTSLDFGSVGQASPVMIRGMTPQQNEVRLDGMTLRDPLTGFLDTANLPINLVNKIVFSNAGPAAGRLDVSLPAFHDSRPYSRVQFRSGDWGYSDLGIAFGLPVTRSTRFLFEGSRQEYDGYFFVTPTQVVNEPRNLLHSRFLARIIHRSGQRFRLRLIALLNKNKSRAPGPLPPDLVPVLNGARRETNRFDTRLDARFGNLNGRSSFGSAALFFSRIRAKSLADSLRFNNFSRIFGAELGYHFQTAANRLSLGVHFRRQILDGARLGDHGDSISKMFIADTVQVSARLSLAAEIAAERFAADSGIFAGKRTASVSRLNPSASARYALTERTHTWISLRQASRYPSFSERYWPDTFFLGKADLRAERSSSAELGWRFAGKRLDLTATLFANRVTDWIGNGARADTLAFGPVNLGDRTISGLDFSLNWRYATHGRLGAVANYLRVFESDDRKAPFAPEYSLVGFAEIGRPMFDEYIFVKLRATGRVYGERKGWVYDSAGGLPELRTALTAAVMDAKGSLIFSDVTVTFSWENLFDRHYQLTPGLFMPPRTFRFSIDWQFWD